MKEALGIDAVVLSVYTFFSKDGHAWPSLLFVLLPSGGRNGSLADCIVTRCA